MKYIFLTPSIGHIGGAEIYISNKTRYLQQKGWDVEVFYFLKGEVMIDNLHQFNNNFVPELRIHVNCFNERDITRVSDRIVCSVNDKVVIESNSKILSFWAEKIAFLKGCKHIIYLVQESFAVLHPSERDFFNFKLDRKELYGITTKTIPLLFKDEREYDKTSLQPQCSMGVVQDKPFDTIWGNQYDYNILSVGRLDKPYILPMIKEICQFAHKYEDKKLGLVFVGDSTSGKTTQLILQHTDKQKNIRCYFLGNMFPISNQIFETCDVCIASSGSARVATAEGLLTITIDAKDYMPIGILDVTCTNNVYRKEDVPVPTSKLLEEILVEKKYQCRLTSHRKNPDYSHHIEVIGEDLDKTYFDVRNLHLGRIYQLIKLLGTRLSIFFIYKLK